MLGGVIAYTCEPNCHPRPGKLFRISKGTGCSVAILHSHVHDNIWGNLPGDSTSGDGVNIVIGIQTHPRQAATLYNTVITGGFDFWGNNSADPGGSPPSPLETGFVRRNLKDIYCATDQPATPDGSCSQAPYLQDSDYGGTGILMSGVFTRTWTGGPYSTAPVCTANDTAAGAAVEVSSSMTTLTITGTGGDTITYTCDPLISHN